MPNFYLKSLKTVHSRDQMPETGDIGGNDDTGLASLVLLLRFHGIAAEPDQIRHRFGGIAIGVAQMLRCAKDFGVKARLVSSSWQRLARLNLPAIAELRDGGFLIIGKIADDGALVQNPKIGRPQLLKRAALEAA